MSAVTVLKAEPWLLRDGHGHFRGAWLSRRTAAR